MDGGVFGLSISEPYQPPEPHSMDVTQYNLIPQLADVSIQDISADRLKTIITEWASSRIKEFNDSLIKLDKIIERLEVFDVAEEDEETDSIYSEILIDPWEVAADIQCDTVEDLNKIIETYNIQNIGVSRFTAEDAYDDPCSFYCVDSGNDILDKVIEESDEKVKLNIEDRDKIEIAEDCVPNNISKLNHTSIGCCVLYNGISYGMSLDSSDFVFALQDDLLATLVSLVNKTIKDS